MYSYTHESSNNGTINVSLKPSICSNTLKYIAQIKLVRNQLVQTNEKSVCWDEKATNWARHKKIYYSLSQFIINGKAWLQLISSSTVANGLWRLSRWHVHMIHQHTQHHSTPLWGIKHIFQHPLAGRIQTKLTLYINFVNQNLLA